MPRDIAFEKWEGLGNDFLVIDEAALPSDAPQATIVGLTDRRLGVGGDGVLFVGRTEEGRFRMTVRNADGSRPEMCGNGLRCVAAFLHARGEGDALVIATDAGPRRCRVDPGGDVTIEMGAAAFGDDLVVTREGVERRFKVASMGNPHAITFDPPDAREVDAWSPLVEKTPAAGTNVEWVRAEGPGFAVVVWERGVGYTQACGTGACAVAAVACATGRAPYGEELPVRLPGGVLTVRVERDLQVTMRGPARRAFRGVVLVT